MEYVAVKTMKNNNLLLSLLGVYDACCFVIPNLAISSDKQNQIYTDNLVLWLTNLYIHKEKMVLACFYRLNVKKKNRMHIWYQC